MHISVRYHFDLSTTVLAVRAMVLSTVCLIYSFGLFFRPIGSGGVWYPAKLLANLYWLMLLLLLLFLLMFLLMMMVVVMAVLIVMFHAVSLYPSYRVVINTSWW